MDSSGYYNLEIQRAELIKPVFLKHRCLTTINTCSYSV